MENGGRTSQFIVGTRFMRSWTPSSRQESGRPRQKIEEADKKEIWRRKLANGGYDGDMKTAGNFGRVFANEGEKGVKDGGKGTNEEDKGENEKRKRASERDKGEKEGSKGANEEGRNWGEEVLGIAKEREQGNNTKEIRATGFCWIRENEGKIASSVSGEFCAESSGKRSRGWRHKLRFGAGAKTSLGQCMRAGREPVILKGETRVAGTKGGAPVLTSGCHKGSRLF
ncbi:Protein of unknown function [Gryllus bimaculatus]|nr:Protein of unknown function [Gryllus bimaculatus]